MCLARPRRRGPLAKPSATLARLLREQTKTPPERGLLCHSPGWTRTNNPPVNSRMLCQLSYRGTAGARSVAPPQANSRERGPAPSRGPAGASQVLARRRSRARARSCRSRRRRRSCSAVSSSIPSAARARVELGQQRDELGVGLAGGLEQVRAGAAVQLASRSAPGRARASAQEPGMRDARPRARSRSSRVARAEHPRRDGRLVVDGTAARTWIGHVEPVVREPPRLLPLRASPASASSTSCTRSYAARWSGARSISIRTR